MNVDTETTAGTAAANAPNAAAPPSDDSSLWWPSLKSRASILRSVLLDPSSHWRLVPPELQQDPSFVIQFLQAQGDLPNATEQLPSKDDFERNFTPAIRQNRQVLLAWTRRPDFATLYEQRHLYVPEPWLEDKEIMLAYAATIPRSLQDCGDALRNDRDMVVTSIQRNGLELQYASVQWQQDETIVRMACANHIGALDFCASSALRTQLLQDHEFVLSLLEQCRDDDDATYIPFAAKMVRSLKEPLRSYPDVLLLALQFRILAFSDLPIKFQKDHFFVSKALERRVSIYMDSAFRSIWKNDLDLAKAAIRSPSSTAEIITAVLEQFPDLQIHPRTETKLMEALIDRADAAYMKKLVTEILPQIRYNPLLMARAVQRDPALYEVCACRDEPDVVKNSMTPSTAAAIIHAKPMEYRVEHQDVVCHALRITDNYMLLDHVLPDAVWAASQPLQKAWLKRHGFWRTCFGTTVDRDMALWVAEHAPDEFGKLPLPTELRRSVDFLKEALAVSGGRIWPQVNSTIMPRNIECAVAALATSSNETVLRSLMSTYSREILRSHLQKKLSDWDSFFLVQCALAHDRGDDGCVLPMLHLGNETGVALRRLMAEFLGMQPMLRAVRLYEEAYRQLYSKYDTAPCRTTTNFTPTTTTTAVGAATWVVNAAANRPRPELRRLARLRAARPVARAGPAAFFDEMLDELDMFGDFDDEPQGFAAMMMDDNDEEDRLEQIFVAMEQGNAMAPRAAVPELVPPAGWVDTAIAPRAAVPELAPRVGWVDTVVRLLPLPVPPPAGGLLPRGAVAFIDRPRLDDGNQDDRRRRRLIDQAQRARRLRRWF
jgi:Domain of unknown function (DUF4116)